MTLKELIDRARGKAGRAIDVVGNALGNPLPEFGISERGEVLGAATMTPEERVATSVRQRGAVAEGDYTTAMNTGYGSQPSRADGGILTRPQQTQNSSAVNDFLKREGITDISTLNPVQKGEYERLTQQGGGGSAGGGAGVDFDSLMRQQRALARAAYEEGVRRAGEGFNRAKGIYDEGLGLLGQRRKEFQDQYTQGSDKILDRYEGERGNLQASAEGARTRSANALRAMGLGGSAMVKSEGRQRQQNARQLGDLQGQRNENEQANTKAFNENSTWANTQESSLRRSLSDAEEARRAAEAQAGLIEAGDYARIDQQNASFLQQLFDQQQALAATRGGVGSFQANPYAVNMADFTGTLNEAVPSNTGTATPGTSVNTGVSIDPTQTIAALAADEERRRRAGVFGGGLYAA